MNIALKNRLLLDYKNRYSGYESYSPELFYNSVLSYLPISHIDRIQIILDCSLVNIDFTYFQSLKSRPHFYGLLKQYQFPFSVVQNGYLHYKQYLIIDITLIPFYRRIDSVFIDVISHLLQFQVIKNNKSSESGFRREAGKILKLCTVNQIELRTDISFDNGGKNLLSILGAYENGKAHINISSWTNKHTNGFLIKAYERTDFCRIEIVLYKPTITLLHYPETMISILKKKQLSIIKRMIDHTAKLKVLVPYLISESFKCRCKELDIIPISNEMMQLGQTKNIF